MARLQLARTHREPLLDQGAKNIEAYEGHALKGVPHGYQMPSELNLVYVDMKQSVPQQYSKNPHLFFTPTKPGAESAAQIFELLVNQKWIDRKMKQIGRDAIKSAKLYGACAFKTYFYYQEDGPALQEWSDRIENDDVRTDRVPLTQLLKDPDSTWETSPWIAHEIEEYKSDIAKQFNVRDPEKITVVRSTKGSTDMDVPSEIKSDFQYGRYWEVEDRRNGTVFTIIDGISDKLFAKKEKSYPYHTMYDVLEYNDLPDRPHTLSDYTFWRPQLLELAIFRSMLLSHARKGVAKYKAVGNKLSEGQITQLTAAEDSSVIQLEAGQDVTTFTHSQIDPLVLQAMGQCQSDIQLISKQAPRQAVGQEKTATEVKAVEFAAREISSEAMERLEEVMASIATKWAKLMHKNYNTTRVVALTEMTDAAFMGFQDKFGNDLLQGSARAPFLAISSQHLSEHITAHVKAGSTAPDSQAGRMQRFQAFASFVAGVPQLAAGLDIEAVLEEAVEVFDVRNDNLTRRKNNPMEESRLLNAGAFIAPTLDEPHEQHIAIHEQESNGSTENIIHILGHKLFQAQLAALRSTTPTPPSAPGAGTAPPTSGQSFVDMLSGAGQGATPPTAPAPAAPLGAGGEGST